MNFKKIKTALESILSNFESVTTDKGIVGYDGDELSVGMEVWIVDENGDRQPIEDGEYTMDNGDVIVVADGKVSEIREGEKEEDEPEEDTEEATEEMAEETEEEPADTEDDTEEETSLEDRISALEQAVEDLKAMIEDLKNAPAAMSATETFKKNFSSEMSGDKKLDRLKRMLNA